MKHSFLTYSIMLCIITVCLGITNPAKSADPYPKKKMSKQFSIGLEAGIWQVETQA